MLTIKCVRGIELRTNIIINEVQLYFISYGAALSKCLSDSIIINLSKIYYHLIFLLSSSNPVQSTPPPLLIKFAAPIWNSVDAQVRLDICIFSTLIIFLICTCIRILFNYNRRENKG